MKNLYVCLLLTLLLMAQTIASAQAPMLTFHTTNFRGMAQDTARWSSLAEYLSQAVGQKVALKLIKPSGIVKRSRTADMILVNPVMSAKVIDAYGFEPIATMNHKQMGPHLAGVIIVHEDAPIKTMKDLADKVIGIVHRKNAAGGFLFQAKAMLDAGLNLETDFNRLEVIQNQNAIIKRVQQKQIEAGCIRAGQLEKYAKTGDISGLRILNKKTADFKFPRTTELYPHWAFSVNKNLPKDIREKIKTALFALTKDTPTAQKSNINGFSPTGDYTKVKLMMQELRVYDFKK